MSKADMQTRLRHICRLGEGLAPVTREVIAAYRDGGDVDAASLALSRHVRELSSLVRAVRADARATVPTEADTQC